MTAGALPDRGQRAWRAGRAVRDHRLRSQVHQTGGDRQRGAAAAAGNPQGVPALMDVVKRRDRVGPQSESGAERPGRLARRLGRLGPDRGGDLQKMRAQLGAAFRSGPRAEARKRHRVADVEAVHRALKGQVVIEMRGVLGRVRRAAQRLQQRALKCVRQLAVVQAGLTPHRERDQTRSQSLLRREPRPRSVANDNAASTSVSPTLAIGAEPTPTLSRPPANRLLVVHPASPFKWNQLLLLISNSSVC